MKRRRMRQFEADQVCARVLGVSADEPDGAATWARLARGSDVVIEAVFEDLGLKQRIFGELEKEMHGNAVLATNTSALPIGDVAKGCSTPEARSRVVGMHYFSPVPKMPLVRQCTAMQCDATMCSSLCSLCFSFSAGMIFIIFFFFFILFHHLHISLPTAARDHPAC